MVVTQCDSCCVCFDMINVVITDIVLNHLFFANFAVLCRMSVVI